MKLLTWWLRIVGCLYLLEGGGLSLEALFARDAFAAIWASTPVGALDEVAVRGVLIAGLPVLETTYWAEHAPRRHNRGDDQLRHAAAGIRVRSTRGPPRVRDTP